jgi:hypothetical protein
MRILVLFIQFPVSKQKEATLKVILIARMHTYPYNMRRTATVNWTSKRVTAWERREQGVCERREQGVCFQKDSDPLIRICFDRSTLSELKYSLC